MLAATLLLVWVNLFLTAFAIAGGELYEQQNLEKQEAVLAVSGTGTGDAAGPSFEVECAKCSFCCTPYTTCAYFDQTSTFTCQPNSDDSEAAAAYQKLVEEAKMYMITVPPGSQPTIAPRAVVNTRKPPHRNGTSGAVGRGEGLGGGFWGAAVVVGALVVAGHGL